MAIDSIPREVPQFRSHVGRPSPGVATVTVSGELDMATVPQLEDALSDAESVAERVVVIDLRGLDFIDLSGVRSIVSADRRVRRTDRELHVIAGPRAERLFALAGLDGLSVLDG